MEEKSCKLLTPQITLPMPSCMRRLETFAIYGDAAAKLLDALVLLNEDDVGSAIRSQLRRLARTRTGVRRKTALYAEREHSRREFFVSSPVPDRDGTFVRELSEM